MCCLEAHFAGFDFDYLANSIIGGNLTNLFTLEIFVRMTPRWPNPPRRDSDPVRGLCSELDILSTKASLTPSGTAPLQNLRIVLSELTFPLEKRPLLDAFADLDRVLSRTQFVHLEKISITLAISLGPDTRNELKKIENETCIAFTQTVLAHNVQICCDALNLYNIHHGLDFWEIRRKGDRTCAESVCVW